MIALTAIGCIAVLISSMFLYRRELNDAMFSKIDVATTVALNEIEDYKKKAQVAAFAMAGNQELVDALAGGDRESILRITNALKVMAQVDYCTILDTNGIVISRTHAQENFGDSLAHLPHVIQALAGHSEATIAQGVTIRLGTYAGAPIYDLDMQMVGVVSLGFRLDTQEFVYKLKDLTACDITVFLHDERISTTVFDEEGLYAIGTRAPEDIAELVLSGGTYTGILHLFGTNILTRYIPLFGENNNVVGMLFVGFDTAEDNAKMLVFITSGVLIMLIVLSVCIVLAMFISGVVEGQLERSTQRADNARFTTAAMFESSPQSNFLFDSEFKVIDCNPAALKLMGFETKSEMLEGFTKRLSEGVPEYQPDGRRSESLAIWAERAVREGYVKFDTELFLNENRFNLSVEFRKIPYEGSFAIVAYVYDMTEKHEREMELMYAHELNELQLTKLDLMVQATKIGLWEMEVRIDDPVNPDNIFIWSDALRHMLGYDDERDFPNVLSSWSDLLHPDDKKRALDAFAMHLLDKTGKTPYYIEYQLLKKNGEYSHFRASGETIRDEDGNPIRVAGALIDISEAMEIQENLRQARDAAEDANRSKTVFLANMSHEIRTPMNSIIGFAELAHDDTIPARTAQYLSNISDNAKWLLNIINDILDNTKIESGKIILEYIPFDLEDVIAQCQSAILPKIVDKGVTLFCYSEPIPGKKIMSDPVKLRQVLMNLLSNAVKFTQTGAVKLVTSLIKSDDTHATIGFEVKDSGIGMSPEHLETIFDPYMQADDSVTRRFGGTGLGLPISKNIVEMMGGVLSVESVLDVGSRFSFELTFDLIDDADYTPADTVAFNKNEKPSFEGEILICEDNGLNQQVICDHLTRVGIKTVVTSNGLEGVETVWERMHSGKKPFDLIFMDIHMPVMDGLEAAAKITDMGAKTPIVAMTANIMSNDLELYKDSGIQDYLGKPFTSIDLWKCLMKYLPVKNFVTVDMSQQAEEEDKSLKQLRIYFAENNQTTFTKITTAIEEGDIKFAHRLAHTLKSNSGQIGESKLQAVAAETEHMLSNGENRVTEELANHLEAELNAVLDKLAPMLVKNDVTAIVKETDTEALKNIIDELEPLLSRYSTESINMLDDIRRIPESDELARFVEDFEFKKAITELSKVKERLGYSNE